MAKVTLKLTFRSVEYHTIEREIDATEFNANVKRDMRHWLDEKFHDDSMSDSDIETTSLELSSWEKIDGERTVQDHRAG